VNTCPLVIPLLSFAYKTTYEKVLPNNAYICFLPQFRQCIPNKAAPKYSKQQPLQTNLSISTSAHFPLNLISLSEFNGYQYILHIMDHLSKFGYAYTIKKRTAIEVGMHCCASSL
jgi:hypothetical protein